jgi:[acyl-carrier-protein] S-malonyltransferase
MSPAALSTQHSTLAFVFPGQGSQSLGMLAELASEYAVVKSTFEESFGRCEVDLWSLRSGARKSC